MEESFPALGSVLSREGGRGWWVVPGAGGMGRGVSCLAIGLAWLLLLPTLA